MKKFLSETKDGLYHGILGMIGFILLGLILRFLLGSGFYLWR